MESKKWKKKKHNYNRFFIFSPIPWKSTLFATVSLHFASMLDESEHTNCLFNVLFSTLVNFLRWRECSNSILEFQMNAQTKIAQQLSDIDDKYLFALFPFFALLLLLSISPSRSSSPFVFFHCQHFLFNCLAKHCRL